MPVSRKDCIFAANNKRQETMNTITLTPEVYNKVKVYADKEHVSVDEFVVSFLTKFVLKKTGKTRGYKMKKKEELSPVLQNILNMEATGELPADDFNGDKARMEHYKEKFQLP